MSSPGSKNRGENDRAFANRNKTKGGVSERGHPLRKSKYGNWLAKLRERSAPGGEEE